MFLCGELNFSENSKKKKNDKIIYRIKCFFQTLPFTKIHQHFYHANIAVSNLSKI